MHITAAHIACTVGGMTYPARPWQMVTWAEYNGAGRLILDAFHGLPERWYFSADEVAQAFAVPGGPRLPGPPGGCAHRRHPRHPRDCGWPGTGPASIAS